MKLRFRIYFRDTITGFAPLTDSSFEYCLKHFIGMFPIYIKPYVGQNKIQRRIDCFVK